MLPKQYALTGACLRLRVAERFGLHPFAFDGELTEEQIQMLEFYEQLRMAEEDRDKAMMIGAAV